MTAVTRSEGLSTDAMPAAASSARYWLILLVLLAGLFGLRLWVLATAMSPGDLTLQVDEAQYWHWSRDLHWGYYSKPPVIAALIAASTAVFGNGLVGVKLLAMLLYPVTALVLARLARQVALSTLAPARTSMQAGAAGAWADRVSLLAAALFFTSPLAGLLGLAVTTDAPLLLAWVLSITVLWQALSQGRRRDWILLGVVWGVGVLAKYTMLSLALSVAALALTWRPRAAGAAAPAWWRPVGADLLRARVLGLMMTSGVLLLMLLPHLAWNADHGWPTLQHTVEITAEARRTDGLGVLASLGEFLGGQWLQFGPFWLLVAVAAGVAALLPARRASAAREVSAAGVVLDAAAWAQAQRFALWLGLPLLLIGATQALHAKAQLNWTAPAAHGLFLWGALWLGRRWPVAPRVDGGGHPLRWLSLAAAGVMGVHVLLTTLVPLATPIALALGRPASQPLPRQWDIWVRMRGWGPAYAQLAPVARAHLRQFPQAQILGLDRQVISMGSYSWRDLLPSAASMPTIAARWVAWMPKGQRFPQDHYQLSTRWAPVGSPAASQPLLVVSADDLPADLLAQLEPPQLLGEVSLPEGADRTLHLRLWSALRRDARPEAAP